MICRLVDDEDYEVPVGEPGELVIRSEQPWTLMSGYLGKPEKTVEAWRNQWLHTGDIFTRDAEGNFYYVDRKKDMIRRRGENVSSVEVEAEVVTFEGVLECAAYGVPSEFGEEEIMVAPCLQAGAWRRYECAQRLPQGPASAFHGAEISAHHSGDAQDTHQQDPQDAASR